MYCRNANTANYDASGCCTITNDHTITDTISRHGRCDSYAHADANPYVLPDFRSPADEYSDTDRLSHA